MESHLEESPDDVVEEDDDDEELFEPTGCFCAQCENELEMVEEVFLLRLVQSQVIQGALHHNDILAPDNNYKYAPAFFCFDCWEELVEEIRGHQDDSPPVVDQAGIILCDICESDVLPGELVGLAQFGEIHWSDRAPNGLHSPVFVDMNDEKHICVGCLQLMQEERNDLIWPDELEPVPGFDVCEDGLFARCWRHGNCPCRFQGT